MMERLNSYAIAHRMLTRFSRLHKPPLITRVKGSVSIARRGHCPSKYKGLLHLLIRQALTVQSF
jgi:hypothetical protein